MAYEMSDKQVEKLISFNINKAIERAFKRIVNSGEMIVVEQDLKSEIRRILKGEVIYWPSEKDMI
jgi:hypothetical protein